MAETKHSPPVYNEWRVLIVTTLTSVATIIGSGILALPVTLYQTTVPIFLAIFTVALVAQAATVYVTIELIQHSTHSVATSSPPRSPSTTYEATASDTSANEEDEDVESQPQQNDEEEQAQQRAADVSLFTLASKYLPFAVLRYIFHATSFLTFIGLLSSYALAGPQAIWQLFTRGTALSSDPPSYAFFMFSVLGILTVIFFLDALLPFFSSLTVVKGGLFIAVVLLVMSLPSSARIHSIGDLLTEPPKYSSVAVAFLMCTVAIGGLPVTIPVTYRLLPNSPSADQIRRYRTAVLVGLLICYILNIGWVIAILQVVSRSMLEHAFENGQITTVPLIESLQQKTLVSPQLLQWVEIIVQLFIIISTIVSFFVMAAGFKNYVDGFAALSSSALAHAGVYFAAFAPIVVLVVTNPKGFITVLTRLTSTTINVQTGLLLFIMLVTARKAAQLIPLPLPPTVTAAAVVLGSTFFACTSGLAALGPLFGIKLNAG